MLPMASRAMTRDSPRGRLRAFLILCGLAAGFGLAGAALADPVAVDAQQNRGYGRIVFAWPGPVGHSSEIKDNVLTVRFDRPIETDFGAALRAFTGYVTGFRVIDGGRTAQFSLTKHFLHRSFGDGPRVIVDLLGEGVVAGVSPAAPAVPAAADPAIARAAPAAAPPTVSTRIGQHDGYGRVVFDWGREVTYTATRDGGRVVVSFGAEQAVNLGAFDRDRLQQVVDARTFAAGGRTVVELDVPEGARLRHFRSGNSIVIDVLDPQGAEAARAEPAPAQPAPAEGGQAPAQAAAAPPDVEMAAAAAAAPAAGVPAERPADGTMAMAYSESPEGLVRIDFDWSQPVAMAAFERAGYLWVVFDALGEGAVPPVPDSMTDRVFAAERVPGGRTTAIRIRHGDGLFPAVTATEAGWTLELAAAPAQNQEPVSVVRQSTADFGPVLILPVREAAGIIDVRDPEVGDVLQVVPVRVAGHAVMTEFAFTQFRLPPTVQGVVVERRDDRVRVIQFANGIAVTGQDGLVLTPVADGTVLGGLAQPGAGEDAAAAAAAGPLAVEPPPPDVFLDLAAWAEGYETVRDGIRTLQYEVSVSPSAARTESRLALARYLMGNDLHAEAIGVLQVAGEYDPALLVDPRYLTMRGVSQFLLGRFAEAAADLFQPALDEDPEVAAWRGAVRAAERDWDAAHAEFQRAGNAFFGYEPGFRARLDVLRGHSALEVEDFAALDAVLTMLQAAEPGGEFGARASLLLASAFEVVEGYDEALQVYNAVARLSYPAAALEAVLSRIDLELRLERTDVDTALADLDAARFLWRGDELEFRLMRMTGELHLQKGDYRAGLTTLRNVAALYPDLSREAGIAQRMNEVFAELFLAGGAAELLPVTALALYYDFRELTPVGSEGDEMVRRLANRLTGVDLLRQAAELLEYQVQFRLRGEEKSRVAASLAAIYLLDDRPQDAINMLLSTNWREQAAVLTEERNRIRARANLALGRSDEGLQAISADTTPEAMLIRADLYWQDEAWSASAEALDAYLGTRWIEDGALTEIERQLVLRLAVSLILARDEDGTAFLRERYYDKLAETPDADAFEVLTHQVDPSTLEFRRVAAQVAQLDSLAAFRESYLSRVRGDAAAAAIN